MLLLTIAPKLATSPSRRSRGACKRSRASRATEKPPGKPPSSAGAPKKEQLRVIEERLRSTRGRWPVTLTTTLSSRATLSKAKTAASVPNCVRATAPTAEMAPCKVTDDVLKSSSHGVCAHCDARRLLSISIKKSRSRSRAIIFSVIAASTSSRARRVASRSAVSRFSVAQAIDAFRNRRCSSRSAMSASFRRWCSTRPLLLADIVGIDGPSGA
eukprot:scaffold2224_cov261-Pinguiococcus_pyrenoidosus.AAC.14